MVVWVRGTCTLGIIVEWFLAVYKDHQEWKQVLCYFAEGQKNKVHYYTLKYKKHQADLEYPPQDGLGPSLLRLLQPIQLLVLLRNSVYVCNQIHLT